MVEKILAADEELPDDWPVAGTTGYEVLDAIGSVLVDPDGAGELEALLARVAGIEAPFHEIALAAKREVMAASFRSDLRAVARTLEEPTDGDVEAIAAITAELDVYRTYGGNGAPVRRRRPRSRSRARSSAPACRLPTTALDRVGGRVLLEGSSPAVRRWQQLSGPVAAKGVEDTAIYRFPALVSRDEVGGDPGAAPLTMSALHRRLLARARAWPGALTPLSTHDTKHSEDTRARIGVLASLSDALRRGRLAARRAPRRASGARSRAGWRRAASTSSCCTRTCSGPGRSTRRRRTEFAERIVAYMAKAAHEEKLRTSWTDPDEQYEAELARFATRSRSRPSAATRSPTCASCARPSRGTGRSTGSRRRCCASRRPACRTSTRDASSGT